MKRPVQDYEIKALLVTDPKWVFRLNFKHRHARGFILLSQPDGSHFWLNVFCGDPKGRVKHPLMRLAKRLGFLTFGQALLLPLDGELGVLFQAIASGDVDECARRITTFFRAVGICSPVEATRQQVRHAFSVTTHVQIA